MLRVLEAVFRRLLPNWLRFGFNLNVVLSLGLKARLPHEYGWFGVACPEQLLHSGLLLDFILGSFLGQCLNHTFLLSLYSLTLAR